MKKREVIMEKKRYKICGLVCILIMSLCGAVFCGEGLVASLIYGAVCALVGFGFWFFASGFMPDAEGKSWLLFVPFTALCVVGSLFFGRGVGHIFFFVAAMAMSLDASLVFYRKEGRPAASVFRLFGISALGCVLMTAAWLVVSGGLI